MAQISGYRRNRREYLAEVSERVFARTDQLIGTESGRGIVPRDVIMFGPYRHVDPFLLHGGIYARGPKGSLRSIFEEVYR